MVSIGLVAGLCDQIPYKVEFEDFQLIVEKKKLRAIPELAGYSDYVTDVIDKPLNLLRWNTDPIIDMLEY